MDGQYITPGKSFDIIQQMGDLQVTIIGQIMRPNPDVTDQDVARVADKFGSQAVEAFLDAQKEGAVQCRFLREVG